MQSPSATPWGETKRGKALREVETEMETKEQKENLYAGILTWPQDSAFLQIPPNPQGHACMHAHAHKLNKFKGQTTSLSLSPGRS